VKLRSGTASISGSEPNKGSTTQVTPTSKNPSRGCSSRLKRRVATLKAPPQIAVTAVAIRNACSAGS
jgi:hypothetical protein